MTTHQTKEVFTSPKERGGLHIDNNPVSLLIKPTYDFTSGEIKVILTFTELKKELTSDGLPKSISSITSEYGSQVVKNYKNISRRVVSFNIKELLKNNPAPTISKHDAAKDLKKALMNKLRVLNQKDSIALGFGMIKKIIPGLGSELESFNQYIKLLNFLGAEKILTDDFVDSMVTEIFNDDKIDSDKFFTFLKDFKVP